MKPECNIAQGFGGNATTTYKSGGLLGHTAIDNSCGYGSAVNSYWDKEYVYKVLTKENPANDGSGFTGVFTIVEQDGMCFEFLYGHCNPTFGLLGKTITKGTVIGTESNNGEVYSGGERITLEMQKSGDTRGTHRHDQARLLRKDKTVEGDTTYLSGLGGGIFNYNGYFYAVPNHLNGYNGCFDWTKKEVLVPVLSKKEVFFKMQQAILDFQLSEGLEDYRNAQLKDVNYGDKTKLKAKQYK